MKARDIGSAALWGVSRRPMRTAALVLSLAAGVAAAVFVGAVISGFGREIDRLAFGAYARALVVRENALVLDRHGPPNLGDRDRLVRDLERVSDAAVWKWGRAQSFRNGEQVEFSVYGVMGAYRNELDSPIAAGRELTADETAGYDRLCLIGAEVAVQLKQADPVGRTLRINGVNCEIVGVLGEPNSRPAARYAEAVIAPFRAAERYFIYDDRLGPGEADAITVLMASGTDMKEAEMRADLLLRKHRGAPLSRASPFSYGDVSASLEQMTQQRTMLGRLLASLATLSILTSLIAFGSIAASSMTSRRREVALRLAMGASEDDIQKQVLLETLLIGGVGGALGLAGGLGMGMAASWLGDWPFAPNILIGALALGLGAGVGLVVGAVLARRAAALPPSLAARD